MEHRERESNRPSRENGFTTAIRFTAILHMMFFAHQREEVVEERPFRAVKEMLLKHGL
jgi:hypothetical protein